MPRPPLILISPHIEKKGDEFGDISLSLSETYQHAVIGAGGLPLAMPLTTSRRLIAACVRQCDGVLLTGGDDVDPKLYSKKLAPKLRRTVTVSSGKRDARELMLIEEVFRQRKPLLAICRGIQMLNVALGGTLVVDIPTQRPGSLNHRRQDKRNNLVHEVALTPDSLLAKITRKQRLRVNSTHHQAVARVANPLRITATGDDGIIEGLELKPEGARQLPWLLAVQFHPERLVKRYPAHREIFLAFTRACLQNRNKTL